MGRACRWNGEERVEIGYWMVGRWMVELHNFNIKWKLTTTRTARRPQGLAAPPRKQPSCKYKLPPTSAATSTFLSIQQVRPSRNHPPPRRPLFAVLLPPHQSQLPPAQTQALIIHCYSSNNHSWAGWKRVVLSRPTTSITRLTCSEMSWSLA
jgi:hypothetical protein